ncbi:TENX protein, partial [Crotophaga sulcirostris]|nr:TENX protein [Crotophaga sulcirostris]
LGELTASQVTPDSVQLEWSVPEGTFDSFTVQYRDGQGQPQVVPVDGGARSVTVPGLSPSRRYKFNLYGLWGRKRLGPSSTDVVTGEGAAGPLQDGGFDVSILHCVLSIAAPAPDEEESPTQPTLGELTASNVTPDSVQLEWSVPKGTFDSFTVQYRDDQGQPQVVPVDGGARSVTVPGLSPSRRYNFYLYGLVGQKRLGPIFLDTMTGEDADVHALRCVLSIAAPAPPKEEPPSQPRLGDLTAPHITPDSVQLEWSVPEGTFDSFLLQYEDDQGQPQVVPVDGGARSVTVP